MRESNWLLGTLRLIAVAATLGLAGCSSSESDTGPKTVQGMPPVGTVQMTQVQAAYIGSGATGHGTLLFKGQSYPFDVSGLGIGGVGVSTIDASGEVYGLESVEQFPGTYVQGRYGFAIVTASAGDLWLKNGSGVILHLKAKREGLMLSLGGDAVAINMTR